ncbi:3'-5'-DNA exonuclease [Malassezia pachydermatis]
MTTLRPHPRYVEIAVNLGDPMFRGIYHGKEKHPDDIEHVLQRAEQAGVEAQVITAGSLAEVPDVLSLTERKPYLFATAGCHPTRSSEMEAYEGGAAAYVAQLHHYIQTQPKIVAVGELGLDYDRLHFSPADAQQRCFDAQLRMAVQVQRPLFLHSRAAHADFVRILSPHLPALRRHTNSVDAESPGSVGVVHSFTGTAEELHELLQLGLYIGINGCSMKTQENLDVIRQIPLHRLMLETDAPWCDIRPTHASAAHWTAFEKAEPDLAKLYMPPRVKSEKWREDSAVKGRCEPCHIGQVAAVVAQLQGVPLHDVAQHACDNARRLFQLPVVEAAAA